MNCNSACILFVNKACLYCVGRLRHSAFPTMVFGKTRLCDNVKLGNLEHHIVFVFFRVSKDSVENIAKENSSVLSIIECSSGHQQ